MNPWLAAGVLMFVLSMVAGQIVRFRAYQLLTSEQRNQVISYGASRSATRLITIMGLGMIMMMLIAALVGLGVRLRPVVVNCLLVVTIAPALWSHATYMRGLRALALPDPFVAATRRSRLIMFTGVLLALGSSMYLGVVER